MNSIERYTNLCICIVEEIITRKDALGAFYSSRQQMADEPEMSMDEINAEVSEARANKK